MISGLRARPARETHQRGGAFRTCGGPSRTSKEVADWLLAEEGVAVLAGTAFGAQGEGFLRLSFANSLAELAEGIDRLRRGLARLRASD